MEAGVWRPAYEGRRVEATCGAVREEEGRTLKSGGCDSVRLKVLGRVFNFCFYS